MERGLGLSDECGVSSDNEGPPDLIILGALFGDSGDCSGAALQHDLHLQEPQVPAVSCQHARPVALWEFAKNFFGRADTPGSTGYL